MERVNVGLIGLGARGANLLKALVACKQANIVALCDSDTDKLNEKIQFVMNNSECKPVGYKDYHNLLNDNNVQAVVVAVSWDKHVSITIESLYAKKITAMEVGGSYDLEECWELVNAYEKTRTPFFFMENCCFDEFELLSTSLVRAGKLGNVVHCHGAYGHDLRNQILGGLTNDHYRLSNYLKRNCENYPTHELGPICKLLDINRGNKLVSLVSVASKSKGLEDYSKSSNNPDYALSGKTFSQGDIVNTIITCADKTTISLTLDTTLPRYYSREFTVRGTKGMCNQDIRGVIIEGDCDIEEFRETNRSVSKFLNSADKYKEYYPVDWADATDELIHKYLRGRDYLMFKIFFNCIINGEEMPIDVYDAATWLSVTALSENSIATGGMPQFVPDFTKGAWLTRKRKDVVDFPKVDK